MNSCTTQRFHPKIADVPIWCLWHTHPAPTLPQVFKPCHTCTSWHRKQCTKNETYSIIIYNLSFKSIYILKQSIFGKLPLVPWFDEFLGWRVAIWTHLCAMAQENAGPFAVFFPSGTTRLQRDQTMTISINPTCISSTLVALTSSHPRNKQWDIWNKGSLMRQFPTLLFLDLFRPICPAHISCIFPLLPDSMHSWVSQEIIVEIFVDPH